VLPEEKEGGKKKNERTKKIKEKIERNFCHLSFGDSCTTNWNGWELAHNSKRICTS